MTEGVGDGSGLIPPIESGERDSDVFDVFESEEPEVSSEAGMEGTEDTSSGVGGPRYDDKLDETYEDSSRDVDESEGENSDLKLLIGDCSEGSTSICLCSVPCSVPTWE